jgi:hypothetical protein
MDGSLLTRQKDLKKEAVDYFRNIFKAQENLSNSSPIGSYKGLS